MAKSDDDLHKTLFGEVKEMKIDINDICIDLSNNNKKIDDEIDFFKKIIMKFIWANIFMNHMKN